MSLAQKREREKQFLQLCCNWVMCTGNFDYIFKHLPLSLDFYASPTKLPTFTATVVGCQRVRKSSHQVIFYEYYSIHETWRSSFIRLILQIPQVSLGQKSCLKKSFISCETLCASMLHVSFKAGIATAVHPVRNLWRASYKYVRCFILMIFFSTYSV